MSGPSWWQRPADLNTAAGVSELGRQPAPPSCSIPMHSSGCSTPSHIKTQTTVNQAMQQQQHNNNNKQAFQNTQLTVTKVRSVTTPKQSGTKRFSAIVWSHLKLSPSCADEPACHSRQSDQNRRNVVQCRTVLPAGCLHQLNVTEDGQERKSVTCRSA